MPKLLYRLLRSSYRLGRWLNRHFTPAGLIVLAGIPVSALIGMDTNQSLVYQIFTFLVALLTVAWLGSQLSHRRARLRLQVSRQLPRFASVGLPLTYKVLIHNQTTQLQSGLKVREDLAHAYPSLAEFIRLANQVYKQASTRLHAQRFYPLWFRYVARRQAALTQSVLLPPLQPNAATEISLEMTPLRRGVLQLQGLIVSCPDPLGLVKTCQTVVLPQSVLVLPKLYHLPPLQLPGARRYQSGGITLSSSVGNSFEFRSLRDYRPEDSPRKIHWKSWAKTGKPIVKEEQDEFFVRHALILDTFFESASEFGGDELAAHECFEEAVAVAASFAYEVQTQESLLDLMFVGLESYCFTVGRGLGNPDQMLEILAAATPCYHKSFAAVLPLIINRADLLSGCICIFLSWDATRQQLIRQLEQLQIPTLVLLIQPDGGSEPQPQVSEHLRILQLGQIQAGLMAL
jgi:uncharacterized protein (DUF58 family)